MERTMLILIDLIFGVPGVLVSIVLLAGRGSGMIAGYNTMSAHKKQQWNEKRLCRATGATLLVFVLCLFHAVLLLAYQQRLFFWILSGLGTVQLLVSVIYINRSKLFRT